MTDDNVDPEQNRLGPGAPNSELGKSDSETVTPSVESADSGHDVGGRGQGIGAYSASAHPATGPEGEELRNREGVPQHATSPLRRGMIPLIAIGAVVVLGIGGYAIWQSKAAPEPQVTPPAVTVTAELPTPNMTPIALDLPAPLGDLLPATTGQFALTEMTADTGKDTVRALESHALTYSVGATPEVSQSDITLDVSRWNTPAEAKEFSTELEGAAASGNPDAVMTSGVVEAGDKEVGTFVMRLGAELGVVTWTNGTTVLQATGPHDQIEDFYVGFPI